MRKSKGKVTCLGNKNDRFTHQLAPVQVLDAVTGSAHLQQTT